MKKIIFFALVLRVLLAFGPYHPDVGNHLDWGIKFWELGPKNFYENQFWQVSWPNQPPGTMYLFALMRKIYELIFSIVWWFNVHVSLFPSFLVPFFESKFYVFLVKLPSILADVGIGYLVYKVILKLKNKKTALIAALVFLFNPVIWYNSAVWGQTDAVINFFGILSIYLFWKEKPIFGVLAFLFSLYFKGSLIIFGPIILLLLLLSKVTWWKKAGVLFFGPILLAYLSFPFVKWMGPVPWLYHLYVDRIFGHQGNMLTANAFNLWALFYGIDFTRNDLLTFLGVTLKKWGQILFAGVYVPMLIIFFKKFRKKADFELIFWFLAVISYASFCFMTNMHERYLYPVFPFLTILLFLHKKIRPLYLLVSLVFFLNMYNLWFIPDIFSFRTIFTPLFIKIFSAMNILLFFWLFIDFFSFIRLKKV